jgi:hypothetical protein
MLRLLERVSMFLEHLNKVLWGTRWLRWAWLVAMIIVIAMIAYAQW